MRASRKLLQLFPIKNRKWGNLLLHYLEDKNEQVCQTLLDRLEPIADDLLPEKDKVFEALNYKDPNQISAVIIGQDPYPNPRDPHGLCFSVKHGKPPASLKNIFKEIQRDFGGELRTNGDLTDWAKQGVLLLNTTLTVLPHKSNCHSNIGWQHITHFITKTVWARSPNSVFLLWGRYAQKMMSEPKTHPRILKCGHPSPLSYGKKGANNFKGCGHFKKANQFLLSRGHLPIVWHKRDTLLDFIIE